MVDLFPALDFLYLHDSALDLHLEELREAVRYIPFGTLHAEYNCHPVICDYVHPREGGGIFLGYGFHPSEFNRPPEHGLVFFNRGAENVRVNSKGPVHASFEIGEHRFLLTDKEFNLDEVVCGNLHSGEIYMKSD